MWVQYDDADYETVAQHHTCPFHERNPGTPHPGCTCWSSWGQRMRDPAEAAKIKAERQRKIEDDILAKADEIRRRREVIG